MNDLKIESIIIKYLKNNRYKTIFPSDIAYKFSLDPRRVFEICRKLKKEGIIENYKL